MIGVLGFDSRRGLGIVHFTTASRTALGPTQPPIQWVPGVLSQGVKRPGREVDHSPPSSAEVKEWVEIYLHSPDTPSWRGAQLKAQGQLYLYLTLTVGITRWEATQRVMVAKLTRLTHKIAIHLHLVAESCTICSSRSRRPIWKLLDTLSYNNPYVF
jgi:hypothetical protein